MKKCSSLVWRFFDRIEDENKRCIAVLCKLCDTQYKYFGNTTNLRVHLTNKHPLQWELGQNGTLEDANFQVDAEESNQSTPATPRQRKYARSYKKKQNVGYTVSVDNPKKAPGMATIPKIEIQRIDILENSDAEDQREDDEATFNLVRHLHDNSDLRNSDEEWLDEEVYNTYEPKHKKMTYRTIKREPTTPPRKSPYVRTVKYEKPSPPPIVIDNTQAYKDEYSVFGEYVANKLRKVKTPKTRGNLQQLITTILWQAEYGAYSSADAVKRLLMYSIQEPHVDNSIVQQDAEFNIQTNVQTEEVVEQTEDN